MGQSLTGTNPDLQSLNALDYKAFRKQLRDVVVIGWCTKNKAKLFDKPHKDMVDSTTWDDGSVSQGARILFRLATKADHKSVPVVTGLDRVSKSRHEMGWIADEQMFFDYIIKTPEGFSAGDITQLRNENIDWDIYKAEDLRRKTLMASASEVEEFDE
tara:strand:+ start:1039 stop:1512 length:474 start_codon:yes stop_codon:yes gene_type:complete